MAGWAELSAAAGEHHEPLLGAVRARDSRKSAARVAAVKVFFDDLLYDRPEISVLPLEAALVLRQKALEMMKKHPVENRALGMPGTIHSRHGGRMDSRNGPSPRIRPCLIGKQEKPRPPRRLIQSDKAST